MSRSKWKGLFLDFFLIKKNLYRKKIKIWSRRSTVLSSMVGLKIYVYNGQKFLPVVISKEKVGFKFGEFSFTRNHPNIKNYTIKKENKKKIWVKKRI